MTIAAVGARRPPLSLRFHISFRQCHGPDVGDEGSANLFIPIPSLNRSRLIAGQSRSNCDAIVKPWSLCLRGRRVAEGSPLLRPRSSSLSRRSGAGSPPRNTKTRILRQQPSSPGIVRRCLGRPSRRLVVPFAVLGEMLHASVHIEKSIDGGVEARRAFSPPRRPCSCPWRPPREQCSATPWPRSWADWSARRRQRS